MAAHAKLGASASERWMLCSASIRLSEGMPNESSIFAMEGTAAHALCEHCLKHDCDADLFIGEYVHVFESPERKDAYVSKSEDPPPELDPKFVRTFEVTDEMAEAVDVYLGAVRKVQQPSDVLAVEQKFDLSKVYPNMFGTADAVIYRPTTGELFVFDFKYGRGVPVDVVHNSQQMFYALGAALHEPGRKLTAITMTIVQPRCFHADGPVRAWTISAMDLLDWSADLIEAAERTEDPNIPPLAGEHCRWCPAAPVCPALRDKAYESAKADFTMEGDLVMSPPQSFKGDTLSEILRHADIIETWITAVRAYAHHEAEAGRAPPGFKLVAKRATRKWRDLDEARGMCRQWGLEPEQFITEKIKTPAQIEKLLPKDKRPLIEGLVTKESSGSTLVPEEDARPPVKAAAESEFLAV